MPDERRALWLVTGASGFLGSSVIERLRDRGERCRGLDRRVGFSGQEVEWVSADITDRGSLSKAFDGVRGVIHAAGLAHQFKSQPRRDDYVEVNANGTANVIEAAAVAGVREVVLVSSVAVYGGAPGTRDETSACKPEGHYATSKLAAEECAVRLARDAGVRLTVLRMATIYGEGDPGNVKRLIQMIDRGRFLWVGDGANRKSLIHRDDAARACVRALMSPQAQAGVFNVSAPACTMREIVQTVAVALDRAIPRLRVPARVAVLGADALESISFGNQAILATVTAVRKWLADDVYDASRFERAFAFQPEVDISTGIVREVTWYRQCKSDSQ